MVKIYKNKNISIKLGDLKEKDLQVGFKIISELQEIDPNFSWTGINTKNFGEVIIFLHELNGDFYFLDLTQKIKLLEGQKIVLKPVAQLK